MRCISPFTTKVNNQSMHFPCGRCEPCLRRRISGWSFRLMQEDKDATSAYFVTFTYDTDHVPITPAGYMTLNKRHIQLFFKRLRKSMYGNKKGNLKYYVAGEYGTIKYRPHYHAILFNADLYELIGQENAGRINNHSPQLDGSFQFTCPHWPYGSITVGRVSEASVGYSLKYMLKPGRIPLHKKDDRMPEFQLASKRVGARYLDYMTEWHNADIYARYYIPLNNDAKIALPRYYKDKIYTKEQREHIYNWLETKIVPNEPSPFPQLLKKQFGRLKETM